MTEDDFNVEHGCEFITDGSTVIPYHIRKYYRDNFVCEPIAKHEMDNSVWIWEEPEEKELYLIVADTARGDGSDSDGFHIIKLSSYEQVGEFSGQWYTDDFAALLVK